MSARSLGKWLRYAGAWTALLAGAWLGFARAFPVENVKAAGKCPPAGEGLNYCILQKAWMPAVMEVLLFAAAAFFLFELVTKLPHAWKAFRAERARRKAATAPPPFETDTTLLAASWGNGYEDPKDPRPRRVVEGPIAVPVQPVALVAVQAAAPPPEPMRDDPERRHRLARIALALDLAEQLGLESKRGAHGRHRGAA